MNWRKGGGDGGVSRRWAVLLCLGLLFTNRMWTLPEATDITRPNQNDEEGTKVAAGDCGSKKVQELQNYKDVLQVHDAHQDVQTLDKTIASLETELSAARTLQESLLNGSPVAEEFKVSESIGKRKYRMGMLNCLSSG